MPNILIVGYGNPLRADDGLGWHAAERLRAVIHDPEVEVLTRQQLTPELMDPISRAERVIFIDACEGAAPGEIRERAVSPDASARSSFSHHATPEALLAGARMLYGHAAEARMVTVTGADFGHSPELTPLVSERLDEVIALVLRLAA